MLNCPHQALVQVVVDFIRVEVSMVKNPLYQIFQLTGVVTVFTDVFLQNAIALCEDVGCIHIQRWKVSVSPGRGVHVMTIRTLVVGGIDRPVK